MKQSAFNVFNNIKMREKLLISYILVVILPLILASSMLIHNMSQMVIDRALNESSVNVDRIASRLNEVLNIAMDISYKAHIDQNLENMISNQYESTQEVFDAYGQYTEFETYVSLYGRKIKNIRFYTYNRTLLDNGVFFKVTPEILQSEWFKKAKEANGRIVWQYLSGLGGDNRYLCLTTVVKANLGYKDIGVICIGISEEYLYYILKNEPYETYICDELGNIIGARELSVFGQNIRQRDISAVDSMAAGMHDFKYNGVSTKVIIKDFNPSAQNGSFKIISIIPLDVFEKQAAQTSILGIVIMVCSLMLAFILIIIFINAISKRIKRLSIDMHMVATGNFDTAPLIEGKDEIGQLSADLGTMIRSIKALVHEVYEVNLQKKQLEIKQKEIKLKMLANQINPHFLFNALETIRMKAHCNGQGEIAEVVKLLGRIMRKNLETGDDFVSLGWELDLVKSYLDIQKFRYGNRIQYEIKIDSSLYDYNIMPLTLQPLIENSIIHGIEEKKGIGKVMIDIFEENGILRIDIEDNGLGMSEERLEAVVSSLADANESPAKRIGIKNVYQRIKLCYGNNYGLTINSIPDTGTRIEIKLPGKVYDYAEGTAD